MSVKNNSDDVDRPSIGASAKNSRLLAMAFVFCAVLLVAFWMLLLTTFIVHLTYVRSDAISQGTRLEQIWAWLLIAALAWALVNLYWSAQAVRRLSVRGFYQHFALTIGCGLIAVGIQGAMFARSVTMQPLVLDYSQSGLPSGQPSAATAVSVPAGDPAEGRKIFSTTCITCHGPAGQGMPNLAPSLVGSAFVKAADDGGVAGVIRFGRAVGDPNNKSGKVMPARGGNPFLTEAQIVHLVAFVRAIQQGGGVSSADNGAATSTAQLARWVVPAATQPPAGFDEKVIALDDRGGLQRVGRSALRRQTLLRQLTLALTSVHGLFLMGVLVLSSNFIVPNLLTEQHANNPLLGKLAFGGWVIAAVAWLIVACFCFWWS